VRDTFSLQESGNSRDETQKRHPRKEANANTFAGQDHQDNLSVRGLGKAVAKGGGGGSCFKSGGVYSCLRDIGGKKERG